MVSTMKICKGHTGSLIYIHTCVIEPGLTAGEFSDGLVHCCGPNTRSICCFPGPPSPPQSPVPAVHSVEPCQEGPA